ncbi:uncharacterized protein GLRG_08808, partial [Colletotrichum graminicola M1.001]
FVKIFDFRSSGYLWRNGQRYLQLPLPKVSYSTTNFLNQLNPKMKCPYADMSLLFPSVSRSNKNKHLNDLRGAVAVNSILPGARGRHHGKRHH